MGIQYKVINFLSSKHKKPDQILLILAWLSNIGSIDPIFYKGNLKVYNFVLEYPFEVNFFIWCTFRKYPKCHYTIGMTSFEARLSFVRPLFELPSVSVQVSFECHFSIVWRLFKCWFGHPNDSQRYPNETPTEPRRRLNEAKMNLKWSCTDGLRHQWVDLTKIHEIKKKKSPQKDISSQSPTFKSFLYRKSDQSIDSTF